MASLSVEPGSDNDDLHAFRRIIGKARIIGFSEALHDTHEWLALRNRVFQYLVEEEGVTAYAAETELLGGFAVDDYVMGKGDLTPELVHSVKASAVSGYEEDLQLIEWMRAYNARPTTQRPVRFYGLDVLRRELGSDYSSEVRHSGPLVNYVLDYLVSMDAELAKALKGKLQPTLKQFSRSGYESIPPEAAYQLSDVITEVIRVLEAEQVILSDRTSPLAWARAYRAATTAGKNEWEFRSNRFTGGRSSNFRAGADSREHAMFDNLRWAVEHEGVSGRVFLHMQTGHLRLQFPYALGAAAKRVFGPNFISIGGISFASDEPALHNQRWVKRERVMALEKHGSSLGGLLYEAPLPIYLLDFRGMPAEIAALPGIYPPPESRPPDNRRSTPAESPWPINHPANQFDAVIIIKKVSRAHSLITSRLHIPAMPVQRSQP